MNKKNLILWVIIGLIALALIFFLVKSLDSKNKPNKEVEKVDLENRKISLDLAVNAAEEAAAAAEKEEMKNFIGKAPQKMGTLGDVFKKADGK